MPVAIPIVPSEPNQDFSVTLDEVQYGFEFRWNARDASWYMAIFTEQQELLARVRVVIGTSLARRKPDERLPPGSLVAVDTTAPAAGVDAGLDDFGTRVQVWYYTREELAAA